MSTTVLKIRNGDGQEIAALRQDDTTTTLEAASSPRLRSELEGWSENGLLEWVGTGDAAVQRLTPSSDPEFLYRLMYYVSRQTHLGVALYRLCGDEKAVEYAPNTGGAGPALWLSGEQ